MQKTSKIYIAGHKGLVGSAILQKLREKGYSNLIYRTHKDLDLTNQKATQEFFEKEKPQFVILAAAKVGGIVSNNTYRGEFIYQNLQIQSNVIDSSYRSGAKKLLFLGSTCIYPKNSPQPMKEDYLLTSSLEYTNEPYAIAKIVGIKMCESYNIQYGTNFLCVMPTNLYGYNDNFDLENSHVLPALLRKIHLAKLWQEDKKEEILKDLKLTNWQKAQEDLKKLGISQNGVKIWGDGTPHRELMWSEDMAEACIYLLENINFSDVIKGLKEIKNTHINIGTGKDISIKELALLIKNIVGFKGNLEFDTSKPNGTMKKLTNCTRLHQLGYKHKVNLKDGIKKLYKWYLH